MLFDGLWRRAHAQRRDRIAVMTGVAVAGTLRLAHAAQKIRLTAPHKSVYSVN
jgi:hypothetical protein